MDRTAAEWNLSLRDPPQAENPASQDSIFTGIHINAVPHCGADIKKGEAGERILHKSTNK